MEDIGVYIKNQIEHLRKKHNISETGLSKEIGYSSSYLASMNREGRILPTKAILEVCNYFDISLSEFFANYVSEAHNMGTPKQFKLIQAIVDKIYILNDDSELETLTRLFENMTKEDFSNLVAILRKIETK